MSVREETMMRLVDWLNEDGSWSAPYGVLPCNHGSYRSVTFGKARTLDCEVRIYSPKWITLRTSRHGNITKFGDVDELIQHLKEGAYW